MTLLVAGLKVVDAEEMEGVEAERLEVVSGHYALLLQVFCRVSQGFDALDTEERSLSLLFFLLIVTAIDRDIHLLLLTPRGEVCGHL